MQFNADSNHVIFSTGRTLSANEGIIGLSPELEISEGYDGAFCDEEPLTVDERVELADYMIAQWQKYKAQVR